MLRISLRFWLLIFLGLPLAARSELSDENLLQGLPIGYKVGFETKKGNMLIREMVPQNETVDNWSEMLTTQIFFGATNKTPEEFQARMEQSWKAACKDAESAPVTKGNENGYPFSLWILSCPLNPATGKPEFTWFKAIKGNDSFYLVQKASKFKPSKDQITQAMQYLRTVVVCDTRLQDRPCPKLEQVNK